MNYDTSWRDEMELYAAEATRGHERACRTCGHVLGLHDWPEGRCMQRGCACAGFRREVEQGKPEGAA